GQRAAALCAVADAHRIRGGGPPRARAATVTARQYRREGEGDDEGEQGGGRSRAHGRLRAAAAAPRRGEAAGLDFYSGCIFGSTVSGGSSLPVPEPDRTVTWLHPHTGRSPCTTTADECRGATATLMSALSRGKVGDLILNYGPRHRP